MIGQHINRATERTWKHRFAQTLYEIFCEGGLDRAAALEDAYAHADAQYPVRGLNSPEDEARSAMLWIRDNEAQPQAANTDDTAHAKSPPSGAKNPHNGAHHVDIPEADSTETDSTD